MNTAGANLPIGLLPTLQIRFQPTKHCSFVTVTQSCKFSFTHRKNRTNVSILTVATCQVYRQRLNGYPLRNINRTILDSC